MPSDRRSGMVLRDRWARPYGRSLVEAELTDGATSQCWHKRAGQRVGEVRANRMQVESGTQRDVDGHRCDAVSHPISVTRPAGTRRNAYDRRRRARAITAISRFYEWARTGMIEVSRSLTGCRRSTAGIRGPQLVKRNLARERQPASLASVRWLEATFCSSWARGQEPSWWNRCRGFGFTNCSQSSQLMNLSFPPPPTQTSVPLPPSRVSLPLPPNKTSFPSPP